jgi:capsular polysaccharide export protein
MARLVTKARTFLFLQGPQGSFFHKLGCALQAQEQHVRRVNLNAGDAYDWPLAGAVDYRGTADYWPFWFDEYIVAQNVTDIILFGDCRPYHRAAVEVAVQRHVRVHVVEEGYIRPNWVTLEAHGVNGFSHLPRMPDYYLKQAAALPPLADEEALPGSFYQRGRDAWVYYSKTALGRWRFPHYRSHRKGFLFLEWLGWIQKFLKAGRVLEVLSICFGFGQIAQAKAQHDRKTAKVMEQLAGKSFFILPLQLSNDFQIRVHSPYSSMQQACAFVLASFAKYAPPDALLVVKEHPLDISFFNWQAYVKKRAKRHGVAHRVVFLAAGDLDWLCTHSIGMVTVNSTSASFALPLGKPVIALGDAVYDMARITHQGPLNGFWQAPKPPCAETYAAFVRVLHDYCLVRGSFASEEAVDILVNGAVARLLRENVLTLPPRAA